METSQQPFPALKVIADGTLEERVKAFNLAIEQLTADILQLGNVRLNVSSVAAAKKRKWRNKNLFSSEHSSIVWANNDNYTDDLMTRYPSIKVLILPWMLPKYGKHQWRSASYDDVANLVVQMYYSWTSTDPLCHWLRFSDMTTPTYASAYGESYGKRCISVDAQSPPPAVFQTKLSPIHFHGKMMIEGRYWPNNGRSFPDRYFHEPPSFVLLVHIVVDAVILPLGNVVGRATAAERDTKSKLMNVKLTRYVCGEDTDISVKVPQMATRSVVYGRVLVASTIQGTLYYHRLLEEMPRVAPYVDFLRRNPDVRIHVTDNKKLTVGMLQALGVPNAGRRVVKGLVRANIAYVPRFEECLWPHVVDTQLTAVAFRNYIRRHVLPVPRRNRVVMVSRRQVNLKRNLRRKGEIEAIVQQAAAEYGLRYSLFDDRPPPTLAETMKIFREAVLVVGPHGAGLANIVFSLPGTYVVEIVCQSQFVRLCFMHTAHVLGHRWHGVPATSGCPLQMNVDVDKVEAAVRLQLRYWNETRHWKSPS